MRVLRWVFDHLAVLCLAVILLLGGLYVHDQQVRSVRNRQSVCDAFEAYTHALVSVGGTPTKTQQDRIDAFERDLQVRLAPLGCHFHLIVSP